MRLKLQKIGNSLGVIFPKEELDKRGLKQGQWVEVELPQDPFWDEIRQYSKEQRRAVDGKDGLLQDDGDEWVDL